MIVGKHDTFLTIEELAAMVGREPKTIRNWIADGMLKAVHLVGVPMLAMSHLESLLTGYVPDDAKNGQKALRMMNKA